MDLGLLHMDILIMLRVKLNSLGLEQGEDKLGQGGTPGEAMAFEQWWILKLKDLKLVPPGNNPRLPLPQRQLNMLLDQLVKWLLPGQLPSPLLLDLDMDFDLEPNKGHKKGCGNKLSNWLEYCCSHRYRVNRFKVSNLVTWFYQHNPLFHRRKCQRNLTSI